MFTLFCQSKFNAVCLGSWLNDVRGCQQDAYVAQFCFRNLKYPFETTREHVSVLEPGKPWTKCFFSLSWTYTCALLSLSLSLAYAHRYTKSRYPALNVSTRVGKIQTHLQVTYYQPPGVSFFIPKHTHTLLPSYMQDLSIYLLSFNRIPTQLYGRPVYLSSLFQSHTYLVICKICLSIFSLSNAYLPSYMQDLSIDLLSFKRIPTQLFARPVYLSSLFQTHTYLVICKTFLSIFSLSSSYLHASSLSLSLSLKFAYSITVSFSLSKEDFQITDF